MAELTIADLERFQNTSTVLSFRDESPDELFTLTEHVDIRTEPLDTDEVPAADLPVLAWADIWLIESDTIEAAYFYPDENLIVHGTIEELLSRSA